MYQVTWFGISLVKSLVMFNSSYDKQVIQSSTRKIHEMANIYIYTKNIFLLSNKHKTLVKSWVM